MSAPPSPTSDDDHEPQTAPSPPSPPLPTKPALEQAQDALVDAQAVYDAPPDSERDSVRERDALGSMIHWVQTLSEMLATAYREQAELETTLTLTKSNLQLAIANNEMLEDALRNRGTSKDVGWRRSRPPGDPILEQAAGSASPSLAAATPPSQPVSPNPPQQKDSRFLSRFRFGSGSGNGTASPKQTSPVSPRPPAHSQSVDDSYVQQPQPYVNGTGAPSANHLTSASLPSLPLDPTSPNPPSNAVSPNPNAPPTANANARARLESAPSLRAELARERAARSALEAEIEALSAALFEEANKMVASERRARAEMQEELHTVKTQRDALKQALRVVESENGVLRGGEWTPTSGHSRPSSVAGGSPTSVRSRRSTAATDLDETPRRVGADDHSKHKPPPLRPAPDSFSSGSNYEEEDEFEDAQDDDGRREDGYAMLTSESQPGSAVRGNEDDMRTPRIDGAFLKSSPAPVPPGGFVSD